MIQDDKYYQPSIEDFRVGYEFEFQGIPKGWHKMTFSEENSLKTMKYNIEQLKDAVRVPFLTKDQIEVEGWIIAFYQDSEKPHFIKGDFECFIHKNNLITIVTEDYDFLFKGECKSINEFRFICKLLKIN